MLRSLRHVSCFLKMIQTEIRPQNYDMHPFAMISAQPYSAPMGAEGENIHHHYWHIISLIQPLLELLPRMSIAQFQHINTDTNKQEIVSCASALFYRINTGYLAATQIVLSFQPYHNRCWLLQCLSCSNHGICY